MGYDIFFLFVRHLKRYNLDLAMKPSEREHPRRFLLNVTQFLDGFWLTSKVNVNPIQDIYNMLDFFVVFL